MAMVYGWEVAVVTLLVLIFTLVIVKFVFFGRKKGVYVCLLGYSDSGKTLLFTRLAHDRFVRTQSSIKENKATVQIENKKSVELVDIPGDERIRDRLFGKYRDNIRAIIVVVDSANVQAEVRNVAELLFDLLSSRSINKQLSSILVACNKQDLTLAKECEAIKVMLEKEITALRITRQAKLASMDGGASSSSPLFLGKKDKDFQFSDLPIKVQFVPCSARGKGEEASSIAEVDTVKSWITNLP